VIIAIALSITFVFSSLANVAEHKLYAKYENLLHKFERKQRLPDDRPIEVDGAQVLIFGMGRVGVGVYDTLLEVYHDGVLGIDYDLDVVKKQQSEGRNVIVGDATDYDFWERLRSGVVSLILLDMPNTNEVLEAVEMIKASGYQGTIAAAVKENDCVDLLLAAGVDSAFNVYAEAGSGFAHHVCEDLGKL
ncbi:MAG: NAD-binding protein, partial [Gammaproteobacteria bacterium]|nr:NAD-binding protein [Gammaproteobacteria bacterium]